MAAYQFLASKRMTRQMRRDLQIQSLAQSGDGKEIGKQLDVWEKED